MRFATWETQGRVQAGVVTAAGLHALGNGRTVLDLVRAGLPAALEAGATALEGPAVPLDGVQRDRGPLESDGPGLECGGKPGTDEVEDRPSVGESVQAGGAEHAGLHAAFGLPGG